jgi:hypothetical protein
LREENSTSVPTASAMSTSLGSHSTISLVALRVFRAGQHRWQVEFTLLGEIEW